MTGCRQLVPSQAGRLKPGQQHIKGGASQKRLNEDVRSVLTNEVQQYSEMLKHAFVSCQCWKLSTLNQVPYFYATKILLYLMTPCNAAFYIYSTTELLCATEMPLPTKHTLQK